MKRGGEAKKAGKKGGGDKNLLTLLLHPLQPSEPSREGRMKRGGEAKKAAEKGRGDKSREEQ